MQQVDVAIIGSGFSGLAMAAALKRSGREDFVVLERAHDVGGTWRDNTYPGCACDVPSHVYSFSFAPNPDWSTTFSPQPEIQAYIRRTAEREGLLGHIRFDCDVQDAHFDGSRWQITTSQGKLSARALVAAAGPLVEPKIPAIPGLESFPGKVFHSARWDHAHDLSGERVAVVGTGASAIQFVPEIQPQVGQLTLFQRTAAWVLPRTERSITPVERALFRRVPATQRLMRKLVFWAREATATPMLIPGLTGVLRAIGKSHLRRQVRNPELRAKLTPDFAPGCKRLLLSNTYLRSLDQPNVEVLTEGLVEVRGNHVVGADGSEREVDTIIFGTGFEVTEPPIAALIRRPDGVSLAEHWKGTMRAHRGTVVAGFPNLYFLLGPNCGSGHMSVVYMAEAQVGYVLQALEHDRVEVKLEAEQAWDAEVQSRMRGTVWVKGGCSSWYTDRDGRVTTLWPDYASRFAAELETFDVEEYSCAS